MKIVRITGILVLLAGFVMTLSLAQEKPKYVGAKRCMACHLSAKRGAQYKIWQENKHSKAFETLGTEAAKKAAAEAGVEGNPQEAEECLVCHVTAYEEPAEMKEKTLTMEEGVSCETCHGPGSLYRKPTVMSASAYEKDPEGTLEQWKSLGLIVPDEKLCVECHNEKSPTFKGFDFEEYSKMIAHPVPSGN